MNGVIFIIEVNVSEDTREPERWVAMNSPYHSLEVAKRKLARLRTSASTHNMPRRIVRYERQEVLK